MSWHVEVAHLERYAVGVLPESAAWSVEAHVTVCDECRERLGDVAMPVRDDVAVSDERMAAIWSETSARIRAVRRPLVERLLVRSGMADHDARMLAATPSLTASWLLGVALVLAMSVATAWRTPLGDVEALFVFLLLAPLVPVAGIGVAFGPRVDPVYDLSVVAPMRSTRLLMLRSVAVLSSSLVLATLAALAIPGVGWAVGAWIVPSLALSMTVLAASARWEPLVAATMVAVGWVGVVVALEVRVSSGLVAFGGVGQSAMLALLVVSLLVVATTHERFDPAGRA